MDALIAFAGSNPGALAACFVLAAFGIWRIFGAAFSALTAGFRSQASVSAACGHPRPALSLPRRGLDRASAARARSAEAETQRLWKAHRGLR